MSRLQNKKRHLNVLTNSHSPIAEAYRSLRTNIDFSSVDEKTQVIMVTSAGPEEGKSTVISNLAVTYAQDERKVLLIDADMRKPTGHRTFQLSNRAGLSSVLSHQSDLEEVIQETEVSNLYVLTAGPIPPNPSEMLNSKRMGSMMQLLREQFDIILIDTPPVLAVTDAQLIASNSDGVLLVIHSGKVKKDIAIKAKENLLRVNARMLGVILNNVKRKASEEYYYYYYGS
ncbi:CpsD/CapB family tyrosine-protein kinase [Paenibacillus gallinarum]|uniref:non-specific protein-tyrosine kinase n=1 Tax=Paenibacillus gallinarum TaxID=2762232 RepID=A0ABR8T469_9BACL|nr:CpsD/CapB family tyrosine-protein kinase [Paenibacillus gallinarum]MBD7970563.1 CpsD/CapB family tyrosine-protein kinase [Paenibacillus gallinarum]